MLMMRKESEQQAILKQRQPNPIDLATIYGASRVKERDLNPSASWMKSGLIG